jgi:hypothetical protein
MQQASYCFQFIPLPVLTLQPCSWHCQQINQSRRKYWQGMICCVSVQQCPACQLTVFKSAAAWALTLDIQLALQLKHFCCFVTTHTATTFRSNAHVHSPWMLLCCNLHVVASDYPKRRWKLLSLSWRFTA